MIVENSKADMMINGGIIGSVIGMVIGCAVLIFGSIDYHHNELAAYLSVFACMIGAGCIGILLGLRQAKIFELKYSQSQDSLNLTSNVFIV